MNFNLKSLNETYEKHEHAVSILFFVGGFLFDAVMLDRIDSPFTIGQQALYLGLILIVLLQMFAEQWHPVELAEGATSAKRLYYEYRTPIIHFLFGTLLNGYTLFFFKSSSLVVSFLFMLFMVGLLVVNESHRFKRSELTFKFALLSLCLICFSSYVVPVAVGSLGMTVFLLSLVTGSLPLVFSGWWIQRKRPEWFEKAKRQILLPLLVVMAVFAGLYTVKLIPPVPLSIPFIGVYHDVQRVKGGYEVRFEKPWWRFWQNGDQTFHAQRTDKVYVFFRIFSPTRFSDEVNMHWYWLDNRLGWTAQDNIPIKIVGGRAEGFRGFGFKSNYQPGEWKVEVETTDGREIGRVYFSLDIVPEQARTFQTELM